MMKVLGDRKKYSKRIGQLMNDFNAIRAKWNEAQDQPSEKF